MAARRSTASALAALLTLTACGGGPDEPPPPPPLNLLFGGDWSGTKWICYADDPSNCWTGGGFAQIYVEGNGLTLDYFCPASSTTVLGLTGSGDSAVWHGNVYDLSTQKNAMVTWLPCNELSADCGDGSLSTVIFEVGSLSMELTGYGSLRATGGGRLVGCGGSWSFTLDFYAVKP